MKPANRERLRRMRAQEMSRWDQHQPPVNPTAPATRAQSSTPRPGADTEARLILLVLAITLSAALLRETPLGSGLSTAGHQLWDLVQSWLG
ncbi:MAG: hypothetical protein KDM81_13015 [Verrucomicrobiae bacterium]|nr:hypothetical protein [Verrucomicrobiae bacterium]